MILHRAAVFLLLGRYEKCDKSCVRSGNDRERISVLPDSASASHPAAVAKDPQLPLWICVQWSLLFTSRGRSVRDPKEWQLPVRLLQQW